MFYFEIILWTKPHVHNSFYSCQLFQEICLKILQVQMLSWLTNYSKAHAKRLFLWFSSTFFVSPAVTVVVSAGANVVAAAVVESGWIVVWSLSYSKSAILSFRLTLIAAGIRNNKRQSANCNLIFQQSLPNVQVETMSEKATRPKKVVNLLLPIHARKWKREMKLYQVLTVKVKELSF